MDTNVNVKAKILKCPQKGNHYMIVGSPYITWADSVQHRDKTNQKSKNEKNRDNG